MALSNPYTSQLGDLGSLKQGTRLGLDKIYAAMRKNLGRFGTTLDTENLAARRSISSNLQDMLAALSTNRAEGIGSALRSAEFGGEVDTAQRRLLSNLAGQDIGLYQGYGKAKKGLEESYQGRIRGIDKQYVRDLQASAVREKQARLAELEENALGIASGLRSQSAMFDAQQQQLAFAQGQAGGSGRETPHVASMMQFISSNFGVQVGGYRTQGSVPGSDHPKGLAVDAMINSNAQGNSIASHFMTNAAQYGVKYIIWNRHIWAPGDRGWRPYNGPSPHTDHVHISFLY